MRIEGGCHCGNIRFVLKWPDPDMPITARACGCTFCQKHGGVWTSNPDADLHVELQDPASVSRYRFGTSTAQFHVCARCGAVPFVASEIGARLYAVVNVNTFENLEPSSIRRAPADFDGEDVAGRLERRQRNWIPSVRISPARA